MINVGGTATSLVSSIQHLVFSRLPNIAKTHARHSDLCGQFRRALGSGLSGAVWLERLAISTLKQVLQQVVELPGLSIWDQVPEMSEFYIKVCFFPDPWNAT